MKSPNKQVAVVVVCLVFAVGAKGQEAPRPSATAQATASEARPVPSETIIPRLVKFSGTLLDEQQRPLAGPVGVIFALYAQQTGGAALSMETQNVKPDGNGNYTVLLGANSANGLPAELFVSGEARWLGIQVGQQPEHERILLVSVPYALKAGDAETLGGLPASAFVTTATPTSTGHTGGASPALPKSSAATTAGKAASTPQPASTCSSVTSDGTAATNSLALFTAPCNVQGSLMKQEPINGFPGVNVAGNNAGLLLNGTGTHQVTVTGATSGRLGQDANGFFFASDTKGSNVRFLTNNGTLNEWMRISSAGNVGIGTTTPTAKLDVTGTANFTGNVTVSGGGVVTGNGSGLTNVNASLLNGNMAAAFAPATGSTSYVSKAGDTMTGNLNVPSLVSGPINSGAINSGSITTGGNISATNISAITLTTIASGCLSNPNCGSISAAGTVQASMARIGSETGTAEAPTVGSFPNHYTGLVVRRINSTIATAGSVVARTDTMTLERDGTRGGLRMTVAANSGSTEVECLGLNNFTTVIGVVHEFSNATTPTTVQLFNDSTGALYFSCSFGNSSGEGHSTEVTIRSNSTSFTWVGTVTSTYNQ